MANFVYTKACAELLKGNIDFDAPDDIRVILVMTNTTTDTEEDKTFIDQFTTLDEMDGANYARQVIANEAVSQDDANDRGAIDGDDVTFANLGVGTRDVQAAVVYKHVTNDADSFALAFIDTGGFPFSASGSDVVIQWNAEGIIQATA